MIDAKPHVRREGDCLLIRIPMRFKKRGGRKEIVLPDADTLDGEPTPLLAALARAHRWQRVLDEGDAAGVTDLAQRLGLDRSYVSRILRLATLAPGIVTAILDGDEPSGLSLDRLAKNTPMLWDEQRRALGFPPSD